MANGWHPLPSGDFGLARTIHGVLGGGVVGLPNLRYEKALLIASDYSGGQRGATHESYAFIVAGGSSWGAWEGRRLGLRRHLPFSRRRMSYKALHDRVRTQVLDQFLSAADSIQGVCACFLVDRSIRSLFRTLDPLEMNEESRGVYSACRLRVFERLLRIVHFGCLLMAGLSYPGQDVMWFTDEDEIAANDGMTAAATGLIANVSSQYLDHGMGRLRFGTARCDNGTLHVEDLVAVPDLVAGAATSLVASLRRQGIQLCADIISPVPDNLDGRARAILTWASRSDSPLTRVLLAIDRSQTSSSLLVRQLRLHGSN